VVSVLPKVHAEEFRAIGQMRKALSHVTELRLFSPGRRTNEQADREKMFQAALARGEGRDPSGALTMMASRVPAIERDRMVRAEQARMKPWAAGRAAEVEGFQV
jgi:hypothetical protein